MVAKGLASVLVKEGTSFKFIILAAGKGTRMKSSRAKVLHEIMDRPMLAYVLDTAERVESSGIYVIVGYQSKAVEAAFVGRSIKFILQHEQLGTGHAVLCAASELSGYSGDVVILCGDVPFLRPETVRGLIQQHIAREAALSVLTTIVDDPGHYGRVIKDGKGNILKIAEDKDATPDEKLICEVNTGIYCAKFPVLIDALRRAGRDNVQGEYYLTDAVHLIKEMGHRVISVITDRQDEVMGINSMAELARAEEMMRRGSNAT
ncbi:MAG: NTP transferase domain-containing protein [Thermodesulfobacteriota bacterium]|nr:NTP transferase domain-containing protein [Thermodesulfobacteriota bacterium]